jgi:AI-2 transport protein TqsA
MEISEKESRIQTACLMILSIIAITFALFWLRPVMIPFVLALFFSAILTPLIDLQRKYFKIPKSLALATTLVIGLMLLTTLGLLISVSISQMVINFDAYQGKIIQLLNRMVVIVNLEKFGIDPQDVLIPMKENLTKSVGGMLLGTVNSILRILSQGILVLLFVCFLLLGRTLQTKAPGKEWQEGQHRIKRFLIVKALVSAITGILVGGVLMFLKIDMALAFGFFAFILNFIPSIGSIISTLLPLPVVLVNPEISPLAGFLAIALPGAVQFTLGNVIEPKMMGDALELHPVTILMALIFWGMIWGIAGMLLAAPLTAVMKIILQRIELTRPVAKLLSGHLDDIQS